MARKKKQKSFGELLYTDITTHSLMAMAVFGLVVSGVATTLLGAQFVLAEGTVLGQTDNAAAVVVAMDNLAGTGIMEGRHHDEGHGPMATGTPVRSDGLRQNMNIGSSTQISCVPLLIVRSLKRGSNGNDVKQLQQNLVLQGLLASSSITGFFGPLTEKAVGYWQQGQGIASSSTPDSNTGVGMVGPRTRALFAKCEGRVGQMLSNGSKGMDFDHGSTTAGHMPMIPASSSTTINHQ